MFVTMSIKEKKLVHAQKCIGECEYVKIGNPNVVIYYKNGDATGGVPFTIRIQTPWQKTTLLKYEKDGCISIDAIFGANDLMYHLFTLVVFYE